LSKLLLLRNNQETIVRRIDYAYQVVGQVDRFENGHVLHLPDQEGVVEAPAGQMSSVI